MSVAGAVTEELTRLYVYGLPFLLASAWTGIKLYGHLDDAAFRKLVLVLLLISGLVLAAPELTVR